tara:strand:+ start:262 stop:813 length:552 start_codon:yes stop_codon:yes gene_type:complete
MSNKKKCSKCKVVKPFDGFSKSKRRKDGHNNECKECHSKYHKQYHQANKEKILERVKQYNQKHKAERNKYKKNRYNNNSTYKLRHNVSDVIRHALTRNAGGKDGESVMKYLPYTIERLKEHLENQFEPWMTWNNHGEWHIDHIYPQSKLPYDTMKHPNFLKVWALENLQPLESSENMSKGNKV